MTMPSTLAQSWRSFWTLRKRRAGALWTHIVIAAALALLAWGALCLLGLAGVITVNVPDASFMRRLLLGMLLLFLAIAWSMLAVARLAEALLPDTMLARLSPVRDWRAAALVSLLLLAGLMLGNLVGSALLALAFPGSEFFASSALRRQLRVLQFLPFLGMVAAIFWRGRLQRQAVQAQAAEAQLRLLQAQIEPHFLFNTLSGVRAAMLSDPARGVAMIDHLVDYLRATIPQLRADRAQLFVPLGSQLDAAQAYLGIIAARMPRLAFRVDCPPELRDAAIPPLMLISLVENAVKHGIELKKGPALIEVAARRTQVEDTALLELSVADDGLGFGGATSGSGIGLSNIRERLKHLYGGAAALSLRAGDSGGVMASIVLPLRFITPERKS
ncbi:MAG TPA: sensor histidine kinase [Massilia sp.]|nr:sensor histidine kinase [Massilia sp.]